MPKYFCCVPGCQSDQRKIASILKYPWKYPWMKNVTFHPFPHCKLRKIERRKWLKLIRRDDFEPNRASRVCSLHFVGGLGPTNKNPTPTLFQYNNWKIPSRFRSVTSIRKRAAAWLSQKHLEEAEEDHEIPDLVPCEQEITYPYVAGEVVLDGCIKNNLVPIPATPKASADHTYATSNIPSREHCSATEDTATQTDMTLVDLDHVLMENCEVKDLKGTLSNKPELLRQTLMHVLLRDDERVLRYTGLPNKNTLTGLFQLLVKGAGKLKYWTRCSSNKEKAYQRNPNSRKPGPSRKLSLFEEFILTLIRLKTGLTTASLADLFGLSKTTVSSVFITWINYLYRTLNPLLVFPSRSKVNEHMPSSFKIKYPKTRVIIDCTEFFIERPRVSPAAQAVTYSHYKHHNTFKVLVGITPNGAFSFVSDLWGGNVSDRHLTQECGILDLLEPGDDVMADRGFTIRDLLTRRHCTLNIPPFTRKCSWGKGKRLNAAEIRQTRNIAQLRIHVERAIERLRRFKLLNNVIPLSLKPVTGQMVTVSAILCNFLPPLVS